MPTEINYDMLPAHCRPGMKRYIEDGLKPGDFLTKVIENDLVHSFAQADDINIRRMFDYAKFLYQEAPGQAWGSKKIMADWMKRKGLKGIAAEAKEKNNAQEKD